MKKIDDKEMILKSLDRIRQSLIVKNSIKLILDECSFIEDIILTRWGGVRHSLGIGKVRLGKARK